ncbi:MAG: peroxide stress protein YaaA, partial [Aquabacterium sp.]|nr:peroxide stress protein YaaA [Aquabacterium sp.]
MLFLLSPAKSLDYDTPTTTKRHTLPQFVDESAALIEVLQPYTPAQIASLMDLSDALASLNVARYGA